jgi:hypothetical protein
MFSESTYINLSKILLAETISISKSKFYKILSSIAVIYSLSNALSHM